MAGAGGGGPRILVSGGDLPFGFGTFFHEYRLAGVLVAVSVLDILPTRTASVYFFYNPDLRDALQLGKLSVLVEAWLTQQMAGFCALHPELTTLLPARGGAPLAPWLDLNFYVHSCRPMRYKSAFVPSQVLCPVAQRGAWVPLDAATRARLDGAPSGALQRQRAGGEAAAAAAAAEEDAREARLALGTTLPQLLCRLRNGQCLAYGELSAQSQGLCQQGMEAWVRAAGPGVAARVLVDPNGASYVGWLVEQEAEKRARRAEEAAEAAAAAAAAEAAAAATAAAVVVLAVEDAAGAFDE